MKKEVIVLLIMIISVNFVSAQLADSPWPMMHNKMGHGGLSKYDTSNVDGTLKWTFDTEEGIESSPVIGEDGTIYFGAHDGNLYAVNPNGSKKWVFNTGEKFWDSNYQGQWKSIMATPAIAKDGTIYIYSSAHYLFAVNPDGTEKWRFPIKWNPDFWSSPAIGVDGTIYIGSARDDGTGFEAGLYAINSDGTLKWIHEEGTGVTTPPSIGSDGTIYIGAGIMALDKSKEDAGKIVAITPDGKQKWRFDVELWVEGGSSVGSDGTIYTGTKEGDVYAITSDGKEKWKFSTGDGVSAIPAIGKDGTIYVGSWDTYFYAIDKNGKMKWRYKTPDAFEGISSSAAIGADGTIYVGSNSGMFYAFNPDGSVKWSFDESLGSGIVTGPAIGADGTVYFGSWRNKLYAIGSAERVVEEDVIYESEETGSEVFEWHPKDEGVDCFEPESPEIEEKCDKFCSDYPEYCPGYAKREFKEFDEEKEKSEEKIFEKEKLEENKLSFFEKIINWFKSLFR